jgi:nucleoside-diphosphate-sugar epimerase
MQSEVEFVMDEQRLRPAGSEVFRLWGDNSKLVQLTGFSPQIDLAEGLRRTIEWFTQPQHLARYKASQYNK